MPIPASAISKAVCKPLSDNNPISPEVFCADPTAVEYQGRLYVYGTNDHQQCDEKGQDADNTYERIRSLVVFSTEDMANWLYHGVIPVGEIAPWIVASWAPSVVARVEEDGLTHFYLYFSNSGTGVGVLTATDPLGPWTDPLGRPLIHAGMKSLEGIPAPFDPGAVLDEQGEGWLAFGGGGLVPGGTAYLPGSARIVKLGRDLLSFASDFAEIPAPYFFEASELNYIAGTYVYIYNTDWSNHADQWLDACPAPGVCSMAYMTTKTPLIPDSWVMRGECFRNPGQSGFADSNNHTHLHSYRGKWYMFSHNMELKAHMGIKGGYRSLCADEMDVDEQTLTIHPRGVSSQGVAAGEGLSPYAERLAAEANNMADVCHHLADPARPRLSSKEIGAWVCVRNVWFGGEAKPLSLASMASGHGGIEVRLDRPDGELIAALQVDSQALSRYASKCSCLFEGVHDLFFVFEGPGIMMESWQFAEV